MVGWCSAIDEIYVILIEKAHLCYMVDIGYCISSVEGSRQSQTQWLSQRAWYHGTA